MGLLDNQSQKKNKLTRGAKVETGEKINYKDLKETNTNIPSSSKSSIVNHTVTEPVNVRVNNHIRNKIAALQIMGYGDSQKEVTDFLLAQLTSTFSEDEEKRFNDLVLIYEDRDFTKFQKKQKNS